MTEDSGHYCFVPINISDVLCDPHGNHKVKTCGRFKKKQTDKERRIKNITTENQQITKQDRKRERKEKGNYKMGRTQ